MAFPNDKRLLNILNPTRNVRVRHPKESDFTPQDKYAHHRVLRITRGIYLMEEWWKQQDIYVNYHITDFNQYYLDSVGNLELLVRTFHEIVAPQQQITNKIMLFGLGATQLLHAAIYANCLALGIRNKTKKEFLEVPALYFTHQTPGYLDTKEMIESLNEFNAKWADFEKIQDIHLDNLVEIITCPNNPDTRLLTAKTDTPFRIYDRVNLWPFFMTNSREAYHKETLEHDKISIFSLPKILSFSGARVGYAFVDDPQIARYMKYFIMINTHGISGDGQIRCLTALKHLVENNLVMEYINWVSNRFAERWEEISEVLSHTELQLLNNEGAGLWLRAPHSAKQYLLNKYKITGTYGPEYGASVGYARLNMQCTSNEFRELIYRLSNWS